MKYIKEYVWDKRIPSDEEIRECLEIVSKDDCIIKLTWFVRYNGWHNLLIKDGMTFEECKSKVPKFYRVQILRSDSHDIRAKVRLF